MPDANAKPMPIVMVIDDDASFRRSTERLVSSAGYEARSYASAAEFLEDGRPDSVACVVLDVRMPGLGGLDLQQELARAGIEIPIIFVTGHGDIPMSVRAMKAGAVEFLTKPFRERDLLEAVEQAVQRDHAAREQGSQLAALRRRYDLLTPRERQVMAHVVGGLLNKQIAAELKTTEKTVKFHRAHIMQKMEAGSLAALVQMAGRLDGPTGQLTLLP